LISSVIIAVKLGVVPGRDKVETGRQNAAGRAEALEHCLKFFVDMAGETSGRRS
jgi:hypothetical protein